MSSLFGGGGGGSPPVAPKLRQIKTGIESPLQQVTAAMGNRFAELSRASYGLSPSAPGFPSSWEAQIPGFPKGTGLGEGALAMMGQAELPYTGAQDPQLQAVMKRGFGSGFNLGSNPWQTSAELGQQFRNPYGQANRNQQFLGSMLTQWSPPVLRLTGPDILDVATQQAINDANARQAGFAAQQLGQTTLAQQQQLANAAATSAVGSAIGTGIKDLSSPVFNDAGYATTPLALLFNPASPGTGGGNIFGPDYSEPPSDVAPTIEGGKSGGVVRRPKKGRSIFGNSIFNGRN